MTTSTKKPPQKPVLQPGKPKPNPGKPKPDPTTNTKPIIKPK